MAGMEKFLTSALLLTSFLFSLSSASKPSGFRLKLIPRDSLESPLYPGNLTQFERIERLIGFTNAKAEYVRFLTEVASRSGNTTTAAAVEPDIYVSMARDSFYYLAFFNVGNPVQQQLLMVDSGSGLIWTQCEPCRNCYPQGSPRYDSRRSYSYGKFPCNHPLCGSAPGAHCVNGECLFEAMYGSGGTAPIGPAKGVLSFETFSFFRGDDGEIVPFNNVIFGCANDNTFPGMPPSIAGIAGFSLSPISFFVQQQEVTDYRFSYCMIPFDASPLASSWLRFGNDIPMLTEEVQATTIYRVPRLEFIFLNLLDISVASSRLNFPPGTFEYRGDNGTTNGLLIDSGAPITQLDTNSNGINAFQMVMGVFQSYYDSLHFQRIPDSQRKPNDLSLCYALRPGFEQQLAPMTYHFQDANYHVQGKYAHLIFHNMFCVAIIPGRTSSILGIVHQQDMRIVYDARLDALQFQPEDCAANN